MIVKNSSTRKLAKICTSDIGHEDLEAITADRHITIQSIG